jgi:hypothetical protein
MLWVVAPLFQLYDNELAATNDTLPPWQKVVGPLATTAGAGGVGNKITPIADDGNDKQPLASLTLAT